MKKKGLLVRVGIDSIYGKWNAPVNPKSGDFVFIPIPENERFVIKRNQNFPYKIFSPALREFSLKNNLTGDEAIVLPASLLQKNTHLDPDFNYLTYGDNGVRRGKTLKEEFKPGDFIVFYAGLKPVNKFANPLYYAIIGFYEIKKVLEANDITPDKSIINAHTRKKKPNPSDVIIIAKPKVSGRLKECILIGEYRDRAYRITKSLMKEWGGISAKNGYIQRSAVPPSFNNPQKFLKWFYRQNVKLIRRNN